MSLREMLTLGDDDPSEDAEAAAAAARDEDTYLSVRGLRKYYDSGFLRDPVKAVDGVSLDIREGETLGLVGESGCGKTTLGRTILGLERATAGEVFAGSSDVTTISGAEKREWQRDAQMVFQDPSASLNDRMSVGAIIREPLDAHDWGTAAERRERVFELLDLVGLAEEHFTRYPHQFSGGQRQRISIARALALEPEFIVLDEPVSALDVSVQARIINLLADLQDELDLTYLFIAHDLSVVRHIADRVCVMYLGDVVERGPTEDVFGEPAHPYTRSLLSAIPGSERTGGIERGDRITLRGTPPNPRYPPSGCRFATRCPAKVLPDHFADLDPEVYDRVEEFRVVLTERARAEKSVSDHVRGLLGVASDEGMDETVDDLFGALDLPEEVADLVDEAATLADEGRPEDAVDSLSAFDSVCDAERPAAHAIGEGHESKCVRHRAEYADVGERMRGD